MSQSTEPRTHRVRALWGEPLVRFLALGALLFAVHAALQGRGDRGGGEREILISPGRIEQLASAFRAQRLRPPTQEELDGLVRDYVRQEVLYREAVRLGIDRDDVVIRRRLAQKMEFLQDDLAGVPAPSDADLTRYLAEHPDDFREPVRLGFAHVYYSADRRGDAGARDASLGAVTRLRRASAAGVELGGLGDPTLLSPRYADVSRDEVARLFGEEFADSLVRLPVAEWSGPLRSSFGYHAVRVGARTEARVPSLAEIRGPVEVEWAREARRKANEAAFEKTLRRYDVVVDTAGAAP